MTYNVGDKVKVYSHTFLPIIARGIVTYVVNEEYLKVRIQNGFPGSFIEDTFFKKQCRRLVKKPKPTIQESSEKSREQSRDFIGKWVIGWNEMFRKTLSIEMPSNKEEQKMQEKKFDPGKPVQTRDGRKARIICDNRKNTFPIVALIDDGNEENMCNYKPDGIYRYSSMVCSLSEPFLFDPRKDLINIPEPKPLDLHVGGIYKARNSEIWICFEFDKQRKYFNHRVCNLTGTENTVTEKGISGSNENEVYQRDLIEKIADIRDLHPEIRAYFEGNK